MPTRNVVLTDRQARLIEKLVTSGRYQNASDVLGDDLRLVEDREAQNSARLQALREAARAGLAGIDAGRFCSFDSLAALSDHLTAIAEKVTAGKPALPNGAFKRQVSRSFSGTVPLWPDS